MKRIDPSDVLAVYRERKLIPVWNSFFRDKVCVNPFVLLAFKDSDISEIESLIASDANVYAVCAQRIGVTWDYFVGFREGSNGFIDREDSRPDYLLGNEDGVACFAALANEFFEV